MSIIVWFLKAQWGFTVHHLTYQKKWSIERLSNLIFGAMNLAITVMSLLHDSNWLIALVVINIGLLLSLLAGKDLLHHLLASIGFQERKIILQHIKVQTQRKYL